MTRGVTVTPSISRSIRCRAASSRSPIHLPARTAPPLQFGCGFQQHARLSADPRQFHNAEACAGAACAIISAAFAAKMRAHAVVYSAVRNSIE